MVMDPAHQAKAGWSIGTARDNLKSSSGRWEAPLGKIERPRLRGKTILLLAAGCLCPAEAQPARAEQPCHLNRIAELPMENHGERGPVVPVRIAGQIRRILLDTGGFVSILDPSVIPGHRGHPT